MRSHTGENVSEMRKHLAVLVICASLVLLIFTNSSLSHAMAQCEQPNPNYQKPGAPDRDKKFLEGAPCGGTGKCVNQQCQIQGGGPMPMAGMPMMPMGGMPPMLPMIPMPPPKPPSMPQDMPMNSEDKSQTESISRAFGEHVPVEDGGEIRVNQTQTVLRGFGFSPLSGGAPSSFLEDYGRGLPDYSALSHLNPLRYTGEENLPGVSQGDLTPTQYMQGLFVGFFSAHTITPEIPAPAQKKGSSFLGVGDYTGFNALPRREAAPSLFQRLQALFAPIVGLFE
ncbi:MAG: hypothetical protein RIQ56_865 [Candidatus Parcubacteria bacterium]|jgi:hypothetical protein